LDQIGSDSTPGSDPEFQVALFTLPPNRVSSIDRRQISVVSPDPNSFEGEEEEHRNLSRNRNALRVTQHDNEAVIQQGEEDLKNADRRNPRVGPLCSPARPRNLEYNGHDVFATTSAYMAAVFQVLESLPYTPELQEAHAGLHVAAALTQCVRKENSGYRA